MQGLPATTKAVAVVCAQGLGDGLISMVLAHNLFLSGYKVTLFSSPLCALQTWFPKVPIAPHPSLPTLIKTLSSFDSVIGADHSIVSSSSIALPTLRILRETLFDKTKTLVANLQMFCQKELQLPVADTYNGIQTPHPHLRHKAYPHRLLIHPMSSSIKKNWPAHKYVHLGKLLSKQGWDLYFCMQATERATWLAERPELASQTPLFVTVDDLACFVYESGFCIGNDSGVGHLAANLGIPTLTLFRRKRYSHLWKPGWGEGAVVTPLHLLPGASLQNKYWKRLLSVGRVFDRFTTVQKKRVDI